MILGKGCTQRHACSRQILTVGYVSLEAFGKGNLVGLGGLLLTATATESAKASESAAGNCLD